MTGLTRVGFCISKGPLVEFHQTKCEFIYTEVMAQTLYSVQYIHPERNSKTTQDIELKLGSNIDIHLDSTLLF